MAEPSDEQTYLGRVGETEFAILQTDTPWLASVDAIVLSVGNGLGSLAAAVRNSVPRAEWNSVDFASIRPASPEVLALRRAGPSSMSSEPPGPQWAILATLHPSARTRPMLEEAFAEIPTTVAASLEAAKRAGARRVLLPIFGTGSLGLSEADATAAVIAAATTAVARDVDGTGIETVLLLARDATASRRIDEAWTRVASSPPPPPNSNATSTEPKPESEAAPDVVARIAGLTAPMAPDLRALLTASVSLLAQKVSENDVLSSTTVFLAAVEWGAVADAEPLAPPELQRLATAARANPDAYAALVGEIVRSVPLTLGFEPDGTPVPPFRVSENLGRAFAAAQPAEDGLLGAAELIAAILRVVGSPEGGSSWLADRLRSLGLEPAGLEDTVTGRAERRAAYAAQLGTADTMSERLRTAIGYADAIADQRGEQIDSRAVFAGLVEAERRSGSTTLSTAVYDLVVPVPEDPSTRAAPFYLEGREIADLADPPAQVPRLDRWSDDGLRLLAEARRVAASVSGTDRVGCRHVFAAMAAVPRFDAWDWLAANGVEPARMQTVTLRAQINFPVSGDKLDAWVALLGPRQGAVSISGYDSDLVQIGRPLTDRLGIETDVEALAAVVMATDVNPPMSIGLFGDWGAGKTYFMSLMHEEIDAIALRAKAAIEGEETTAFCSEVVQIDFNAWHFVDSNLWASIVTRIFSELARHLGGSDENDYRRALQELLDKTQRAKDVVEQVTGVEARLTEQIEEYRAELQRLDEEIGEKRQQTPSVDDIIGAAIRDPRVVSSIESASRTLGVDEIPRNAAALWDALARARSFPSRVRGLANWLTGSKGTPSRARRVFSLLALVAIVIGVPLVAAGIVAVVVRGPDQTLAALIGFVASVLAVWAAFIRRGVSAVDRALRELETARDRLNTTMTAQQLEEQQKLTAQLKSAEVERVEASRRLAEAQAELTAAKANQDKLDLSAFLFEWIVQRSSRTEYRDQLGIISFIREDFEELGRLLKEKGTGDSALHPVDRIVLYIDDLDRCPSDRVIEVLQAVHLLLAFPLFVVVVGVDPRWLLHSLEHEYTAFGASTLDERSESRNGAGQWRTTPHHYLEKIFQIPFTLRPMGKTGFANLVTDLAGTTNAQRRQSAQDQAATGTANAVGAPGPEPSGPDAPRPSRSDDDPANRADTPTAPDDGATGAPGPVNPAGPSDAVDAANPPDSAAPASSPSSTPPGADGAAAQRSADIDPAPRFLEITDDERAFMAGMGDLVTSPRATKRLINTYRLVKATMAPMELVRLESGDYRAALLMLAMQGGHPDEAADVFRELHRRDEGSWWAFVDEWEPRARAGSEGRFQNQLVDSMSEASALGWRELHDAMARQRPSVPDDDLRTFVRLWPAIARFGFATGRAVTKGMA